MVAKAFSKHKWSFLIEGDKLDIHSGSACRWSGCSYTLKFKLASMLAMLNTLVKPEGERFGGTYFSGYFADLQLAKSLNSYPVGKIERSRPWHTRDGVLSWFRSMCFAKEVPVNVELLNITKKRCAILLSYNNSRRSSVIPQSPE